MAYVDVFPNMLVSEVQRLPDEPNFQTLVSAHKIFPFIIYMSQEIVYYKPLELNEKYQKHFVDTGAYIQSRDKYDVRPWAFAAKRLKKNVGNVMRKNSDTRTCFQYGTHFFLVKSCFTPGQRTVAEGQKHVYQIGAVQMVLYFVGPGKRCRRQERLLPVNDQCEYDQQNLDPYTAYAIPEGVTYILYATNKAYFSVHVTLAESNVAFPCTDPVREHRKRPAPADFVDAGPPLKMAHAEESVRGDEGPASDPVLLELESGLQVKESMLMPAPCHITFASGPMENVINVVHPTVVEWYQKNVKWKEVSNPEVTVVDEGVEEEPLDLSVKALNPSDGELDFLDSYDYTLSTTDTIEVDELFQEFQDAINM